MSTNCRIGNEKAGVFFFFSFFFFSSFSADHFHPPPANNQKMFMCVSEIDLEVFWRPLCARRSTEKLPTSCNAPCFHQEKTFYCHQRFKANYFLCSVATIPSWRVLVFVLPLWVSFPVWLFAPPLKPLQVCSSHLSFPLFLSVFPCVSTFFHLLLRAEFVPLEDPPPTRVEIESPAPEFSRCFFRPPPPPLTTYTQVAE